MLEQDSQAVEQAALGEQKKKTQAALNTCQRPRHKGRI